MTLYTRELGEAIAQTTFDTGESHERAVPKSLLNSQPSRAQTCSAAGQKQLAPPVPTDRRDVPPFAASVPMRAGG